MKWERGRMRILAAAGALAALAVLMLSTLLPVTAAADGGQAFSIAPPLLSLKTDPGKTVIAEIRLTNVSNGPMIMSAQANDFAAKDENGDPNIILNTSDSVPFSLREWVQLPAPFTLASKQTKTLEIPIAVPASGEPGGHYGVIRFTGTAPGANGTGVSLSASIGTLVLLQVSGNLQERASLADFYSANAQFTKKSSFQYGPVNFVTRVSDDGNIHLQPTGTITVKNLIGQKVATLRVNGDPSSATDIPKNILPSSIRRFQNTLNKKWLFGRYTARLDLTYGQDHKHLTANVSFWVIPYAIIVPAIIGLLIIAFGLRFGIRRYNAHIIKKAQGSAGRREPPTV
ncbi:MAG TPA: hypothetical protein VLG11_05275 [Candidatus Saccharimonadales bacterium]|nr:hypothetical protein [Candidatus Saccharimonadales bacterium]